MGFLYHYRRIGCFVIDCSIAAMFTKIVVSVVYGLLLMIANHFSLTVNPASNLVFFTLIAYFLITLILFIAIYLLYHTLCYRLLGGSLSRYFLRLKLVDTANQPIPKKVFLKREFYKIYISVASLGVYPIYQYLQFMLFSRRMKHDELFHTQVIEG